MNFFKLLLLLLLAAPTVLSCTGNGNTSSNVSQDSTKQEEAQPANRHVASLTLYFAKKEVKAQYETIKPGELITHNYEMYGPEVKDLGESYEFSWIPDNDIEPIVRSQVFKTDVDVKTINPGWISVADAEKGINFESKKGNKIRLFQSNSNGHKYTNPCPWPEDKNWLTKEQLDKCFVMEVAVLNETDKKYNYTYYHFGATDGFVDLYELKDGRLAPLATSRYMSPWSWGSKKGSAYDENGNLLVDMEKICDEVNQDAIAYDLEQKAIYLNIFRKGEFYFRK